jgi:hypothetical protein
VAQTQRDGRVPGPRRGGGAGGGRHHGGSRGREFCRLVGAEVSRRRRRGAGGGRLRRVGSCPTN